MSRLFEPLTLRGLTFPNRVWVSPMCQYSSVDGFTSAWHLPHLGALASGRPGLLITEATAVVPEGRISPDDLGIWTDAHAEALRPAIDFAHSQHVPFAVQLAHAGRKASTWAPWKGEGSVSAEHGGWPTVGPSAVAFGSYAVPRALSRDEVAALPAAFADAARRAIAVGADTVEIHAAHGYLLHEFLSPLSNLRDDAYGGSLENRMRLPLEVVDAIRAVLPDAMPLVLRVSATDWVEGGWDVEQTVVLAREAATRGVDLVDVSSAGLHHEQKLALGPGYQVPFAAQVRAQAGVPTGAVGLITEPRQAEQIVAEGSADVVLLARALLREPRWPLLAAAELGASIAWPEQYLRARPA